MSTDSESTSFWYQFFTAAGIPASDASSHAVSFTKHRIQMEMLPDLTKEYLNDMGVTMMGDVIAILKHAKVVAQQTSKEEAIKGLSVGRPRTPPRRSTPASRTVAHYLERDEKAGPMNEPMIPTPKISQDLAARLGPVNAPSPKRTASPVMVKLNNLKQKEVVPVPKSRRVLPEHEGKYTIKMPRGTTAKTKKIMEKKKAVATKRKLPSVFDRLGQGQESEGPKFNVTGLDKIVIHKSTDLQDDPSVFNRLGGKVIKRAATSTVPDSSDTDSEVEMIGEPLEYHGVLKDSPLKKKIKIQRKPVEKVEAQCTGTKPSTEGIFSPFSAHNKKPVTARLGSSVVAEAQTTTTVKKTKSVSKRGVEGRLGPPIIEKATLSPSSKVSKGVFSRLGKQLLQS